MANIDLDILNSLCLSQSEFARIIGVSRQAVNIGIRRKEGSYINKVYLLLVHDSFKRSGDPRLTFVLNILEEKFNFKPGIDIEKANLSEREMTHKRASEIFQGLVDRAFGHQSNTVFTWEEVGQALELISDGNGKHLNSIIVGYLSIYYERFYREKIKKIFLESL